MFCMKGKKQFESVLSTFLTYLFLLIIKVKLVDEMMNSPYLCVILCVKPKKYHFSRFYPFF